MRIRTGKATTIFATIAAAVLLSMAALVNAVAAPAQLYGKSIVVSWSDSREQTFEGETHSQFRTISFVLRIYISSAGRAFSELHASSQAGRRNKSAQSAQGPGDREPSQGGSRVVHFEGGALLVDTKMQSGARRVMVSFDGGYTGCNARVIHGKEDGARSIRQKGLISGRHMEIHSIQSSAANCSVRDGNVFGGG